MLTGYLWSFLLSQVAWGSHLILTSLRYASQMYEVPQPVPIALLNNNDLRTAGMGMGGELGSSLQVDILDFYLEPTPPSYPDTNVPGNA